MVADGEDKKDSRSRVDSLLMMFKSAIQHIQIAHRASVLQRRDAIPSP